MPSWQLARFWHRAEAFHLFVEQLAGGPVVLQCVLDGLYLHGDGGEHGLFQTIELIKTTPRSTLHQPHKDPAHGLHIYTLKHRDIRHFLT